MYNGTDKGVSCVRKGRTETHNMTGARGDERRNKRTRDRDKSRQGTLKSEETGGRGRKEAEHGKGRTGDKVEEEEKTWDKKEDNETRGRQETGPPRDRRHRQVKRNT